MEIYRYGKIVHTTANYIILDSNYSGLLLYVARSERFKKDENRKIYIYTHHNEYSKTMFGFENFKEKILFEDLISVSGIGPKTSLAILNNGWEVVMLIIAEGDWEQLAKFPYVSLRNAKQIILEFQDKYHKFLTSKGKVVDKQISSKTTILSELESTLKMLGFKKTQIDYAVDKVDAQDNIDIMVEKAIKLISDARELRT